LPPPAGQKSAATSRKRVRATQRQDPRGGILAKDLRDRPNPDASDAADRYRQAAEHTLDQLEWTVDYLHSIRKTDIARALAKNGLSIRRRMSDRP